MGSPNEGTSIDENEGANRNDTTDALPGGIAYVFVPLLNSHTYLFCSLLSRQLV